MMIVITERGHASTATTKEIEADHGLSDGPRRPLLMSVRHFGLGSIQRGVYHSTLQSALPRALRATEALWPDNMLYPYSCWTRGRTTDFQLEGGGSIEPPGSTSPPQKGLN